MKDKRVVIEFRHLNIRIAKNNLAYPLLKNTFSGLGNSRCEVLSVLDLKDVIHVSKAFMKIQKDTVQSYHVFWYGTLHLYQRFPVGLNI